MSKMNIREMIGKHMLADGMDLVVDLHKSQGPWIYDSQSGRTFLDLFSCFASLPVGYNHPYIAEKSPELGKIAINKPSNSDLYTLEFAQFVETFSRVGIPEYLPHAFFISGGALAVENALKAAFDWKIRKNLEKGISAEKGYQVIHFKEAFHGRSGYTLSLTNTADPNKTKYFPKFNWPRITNPKIQFPLDDENLENVVRLEKTAVEEIKSALSANRDDIAALIIEPVQGEGGDNHFRNEFFITLRELADENEFMFIMDEIQTGVGLTGKMWAHDHFPVNPDIIAFGKKTQVCGILCSNRIDEVPDNVFRVSSRINSTEGGNLVDMVRFRYVLEIIEKEGLVENAAVLGNYLLEKLSAVQDDYSGLVSNARGKGLMAAFDLPNGTIRNQLIDRIFDNGAIILPSGTQSIRFRPGLNITRKEIDMAIDIVRKSLRSVEK